MYCAARCAARHHEHRRRAHDVLLLQVAGQIGRRPRLCHAQHRRRHQGCVGVHVRAHRRAPGAASNQTCFAGDMAAGSARGSQPRLLLMLCVAVSGCKRTVSDRPIGPEVQIKVPLGLPPLYHPQNNPPTADAIALGGSCSMTSASRWMQRCPARRAMIRTTTSPMAKMSPAACVARLVRAMRRPF